MKNKRNIKWLLLIVFAFAVMSGGSSGCGGSGDGDISETRARELIAPFYELFMSSKWEETAGVRDFDEGFKNRRDDWLSYDFNPIDGKEKEPNDIADTEFFLGYLMFPGIPNLDVEILWLRVVGDWIIVRSELTGTFLGPEYLGIPVGPNPFAIMALDYHRVDENGKLVELYHAEHWADAVVQSNTP